MEVTHLFVYGSLRQGFQNPVFDYIKNHFTFLGLGKANGQLFDLGEYPAAVPSANIRGIVGELYIAKSTEDFFWAISQLDDYEGLNPEEGEKLLYVRELTTVFQNGTETQAWIYWYTGDVSNKPVIESGDVLEYFKQKQKATGS